MPLARLGGGEAHRKLETGTAAQEEEVDPTEGLVAQQEVLLEFRKVLQHQMAEAAAAAEEVALPEARLPPMAMELLLQIHFPAGESRGKWR